MNFSDVLMQTYFDTCEIYRYEETVQNNITRQKEVLKYSGVRCALSQGSLVKASGGNVTEISSSSKVFFPPDTDIKEGDRLLVTQQGSNVAREYKAGECFIYAGSHIEVRVSRSEKL